MKSFHQHPTECYQIEIMDKSSDQKATDLEKRMESIEKLIAMFMIVRKPALSAL